MIAARTCVCVCVCVRLWCVCVCARASDVQAEYRPSNKMAARTMRFCLATASFSISTRAEIRPLCPRTHRCTDVAARVSRRNLFRTVLQKKGGGTVQALPSL